MSFVFYAELQDGRNWENDFWEKLPDDSQDALGVTNFVEIAPSCSASEICGSNTF